MYLERSGVNGYSVQIRVDAGGMAIFLAVHSTNTVRCPPQCLIGKWEHIPV
jgi:hypothetical protein